MSQKLPVSDFKWKKNMSKFTKEFIKNYDEDSDKGYIIQVDVGYGEAESKGRYYPEKLHDLHSDLPFLPERMKINKCTKLVCKLYDKKKLCCSHKSFKSSLRMKINKCTKLVCNLYDKKSYVVHIRALNQALE